LPSNASKPAETDEHVVVENVPEKATIKGPVWNLDTIPQLDGSPESSENTEDEETFSEFIEQIRFSDLNSSDDIDDTEDCLSKILHENDIHVKNLEISKEEILYFIEPFASTKICELHKQLKEQKLNISVDF